MRFANQLHHLKAAWERGHPKREDGPELGLNFTGGAATALVTRLNVTLINGSGHGLGRGRAEEKGHFLLSATSTSAIAFPRRDVNCDSLSF